MVGELEFDPAKDARSREKHGMWLGEAARIGLETARVIADERFAYGEARFQAFGLIDGRLHVLAFTMRGAVLRAIDLRKANAREVRRHEESICPPAIDEDNPELTAEDFARAKPFEEVFPEQYKGWKKPGRPPVEAPKVHIGFRLAADMVSGIRSSGRRYNARVERVLREAIARGEV